MGKRAASQKLQKKTVKDEKRNRGKINKKERTGSYVNRKEIATANVPSKHRVGVTSNKTEKKRGR